MTTDSRGVGRLSVWLGLLAVLGAAGCASPRSPESETAPVVKAGPVQTGTGDAEAAATDGRSPAAQYNIPPGHLPPPGMCRVWVPGEPPGQQEKEHPVGRCSTLRASIPAGAWLVYRPTDDGKHVRVWQYGEDRRVLAQRIYDIATGELIRHVAPTSGG